MKSVALALLLVVPLSASAKSKKKPIELISTEDVVAMVSGDGVVEVGRDSVGDPLIQVTGDSLSYVIQFYDCTPKGCGTLQFRSWWNGEGVDLPHELFSKFEMEWRTGRVFKDHEGDAVLETLVPLDGGVRMAHVEARHEDFINACVGFGNFLADNVN